MFLSNAEQIRDADHIMIQEMDFPGILLMEEAGKKATEKLLKLYPDKDDFIIIAGPGNNGGDGWVIARYLHLWGKHVQVYCSYDPLMLQGDARINFDIVRHLPIAYGIWNPQHSDRILDEGNPPVLVDALLGTGIRETLRDPIATMLAYWREKSLPVVAIDLPSGLSAETGTMINEVLSAEHTLTFQLPKICHHVYPAAGACGKIHVLDIGIWPPVIERLSIQRRVLDDRFVKDTYLPRTSDSHKGSFGHALVVGGSYSMSGAIAMTAQAIMRSGAGLCTVLCPAECSQTLMVRTPEVMCLEGEGPFFSVEDVASFLDLLPGKDVVVIGPGMRQEPATLEFLESVLEEVEVPIVLDADALNLLAQMDNYESFLSPETVLTPHPGEMQRLIGDPVQGQRLEVAEQFAQETASILVLKGAGTIIALPDGKTFVNPSGNPGMATGGSGDVLTGIIGGLIAQGYTPAVAAPLGAYLHGKTGDKLAEKKGMEGLLASDMAESLPSVWKDTLVKTEMS
ncbi:MAG: NAD(P)H-hydrate dehydratase [Bacteroidota bacterium]